MEIRSIYFHHSLEGTPELQRSERYMKVDDTGKKKGLLGSILGAMTGASSCCAQEMLVVVRKMQTQPLKPNIMETRKY